MGNHAKEVDALLTAGAMLANCAFNLAQSDKLDARQRRSLDDSRKAWDAALSNFPATLRQQAGRVDVSREMVERARYAYHDATRIWPRETGIRAALTAALAQNTQGSLSAPTGDAPQPWTKDDHERLDRALGIIADRRAERARVPDSDRIDWMEANARSVSFGKAPQQGYWVHVQGVGYSGGSNKSLRDAIDAARKAQAAAPSQRAEVK